MTYDEKLCKAVEALGLHIEPGLDTSAEGEYVVYAYTLNGTLWGDDAPCVEHCRWVVTYVAPLTCDRRDLRLRLMQAIYNTFDAWPEESGFADISGQQWMYEFDTIGVLDIGTNGDE